MNTTPRTDAEQARVDKIYGYPAYPDPSSWGFVSANFARTLEQELSEAIKQRDLWQEDARLRAINTADAERKLSEANENGKVLGKKVFEQSEQIVQLEAKLTQWRTVAEELSKCVNLHHPNPGYDGNCCEEVLSKYNIFKNEIDRP